MINKYIGFILIIFLLIVTSALSSIIQGRQEKREKNMFFQNKKFLEVWRLLNVTKIKCYKN